MLIVKRMGAVAIVVAGLAAIFTVDPVVALGDDDKLSLTAAVLLALFAIGAALWWDWSPEHLREQAAPKPRPSPPNSAVSKNAISKSAIPTLALMAAALVVIGGASQARAETAEDRMACTPSVFMLCPAQALSGNREAATQCLIANLAKASPRCQAVVRAVLQAGPPTPTRLAMARTPGRRD
jgi:hypothetical protein